jgi:hypothetical protein
VHEGLGILKAGIHKLELGSKLRKDVWLRELDEYEANPNSFDPELAQYVSFDSHSSSIT